jgi:hypothetical protein
VASRPSEIKEELVPIAGQERLSLNNDAAVYVDIVRSVVSISYFRIGSLWDYFDPGYLGSVRGKNAEK